MKFKQSLLISMSQAIAAAFPGVSRSGITMTVGRGMGLKRESVAKYSFLLSTPIVAAAALYELKHFVFNLPVVIGVLASFVVGVIVIKFLLEYLKKGSFKGFAIYNKPAITKITVFCDKFLYLPFFLFFLYNFQTQIMVV